jgi:hypothetical protein
MCGDIYCGSCGPAQGFFGEEADLETPKEITGHQGKYHADAWMEYTPQELGNWIHLLIKRSTHRTSGEKALKDATDASNYLSMLKSHVDAALRNADERRLDEMTPPYTP